jgi:hypothetical protein
MISSSEINQSVEEIIFEYKHLYPSLFVNAVMYYPVFPEIRAFRLKLFLSFFKQKFNALHNICYGLKFGQLPLPTIHSDGPFSHSPGHVTKALTPILIHRESA